MAATYQKIHEKCEVQATFVPGKRPQIDYFVWKDKVYEVEETSMLSKAKKGVASVWLINVATNTAAFTLRFDADIMQWWVEELMWEE